MVSVVSSSVLILLFSVVHVTISGAEANGCQDLNLLDGLNPDPYNCAGYIMCTGGQIKRENCPLWSVFNPKINNCDSPLKVPECTDYLPYGSTAKTTLETSASASTTSSKIVHTSVITQPIGTWEPTSAPLTTTSKVPSSKVTTVTTTTTTTKAPSTTVKQSTTTTTQRPRTTTRRPRTTTRRPRTTTRRPRTTTRAPKSTKPPKKVEERHLCEDLNLSAGIHPNPFDCSKFIECANHITFIFNCNGLRFDTINQVCDYARNVDCQKNYNFKGNSMN